MENTATINDKGDTITIKTSNKPQTAIYLIQNAEGNTIGEYNSVTPAALTPNSTVAREIKRLIDPEDKFKPALLNKEFSNIKELLQLQYDTLIIAEEEEK